MTFALINRRIQLPSTTDLGYPTESVIPYVLGDFHSFNWADHATYYGGGTPKISIVAAHENSGSATWKVEFDSASNNWNVYQGGAANSDCSWGEHYTSDGQEVSFSISRGASAPSHGDYFQFQTHQGGRLSGYRISDTPNNFVLAVDHCTVTSVWDGTTKLTEGTHYEVFHSAIQGHDVTWIQITGAVTGAVTWTGYGALWGESTTAWAHEHARQIIWRWAAPDFVSTWTELIDVSSYWALARTCADNGYRTRTIIRQREPVRTALEKLLMGISSWATNGVGQIRFLPLRYEGAADPLIDVAAHRILEYPEWSAGGRANLKNTIRVYYDGYSGSSSPGYVDTQDDRSIRKHGERQGSIDERYKVTAEAIYHKDAATILSRAWLRRNAAAMENVILVIDIFRYANMQLGDEISYTCDHVPNRTDRCSGVEDKSARVVSLAWDIDNYALYAGVEHIPAQTIELGGA